ncbi:Tc1-like transposase DDE domain-containing protein [Plasmodiophora brassicae]
MIVSAVRRHHASADTRLHCLYGYYILNLGKNQLAFIYGKSPSTISNWIQKYERDGSVSRKVTRRIYKKHSERQRRWIVELFSEHPTLFLHEARARFAGKFAKYISCSEIWAILQEARFTRKHVERRALQIRKLDIVRFCNDMHLVRWSRESLVFLDEFGVDNRDMLRTKGFCLVGKRLIYRGQFSRKPRRSMLAFASVRGLEDVFSVEGTFDRKTFFNCCRQFVLHHPDIRTYPGRMSVWIMDGARIHCHPGIVNFLRSLGIMPIFLPAYCPFYNPIELLFGMIKRRLRELYDERSGSDITAVINDVLVEFSNRSMEEVFKKCGYVCDHEFDPSIGMHCDLKDLEFDVTVENRAT